METSLFLAKILGLLYLTVGVGILLNKDHYNKLMKECMNSAVLMYFGGALALVAGLVIVMFHNIWLSEWYVIITVIGWLALVKGIVLLVSPKSINNFAAFWVNRMQLAGLVTLILGLVLGYYGYLA
jgi:hypothetical protein